MIDTALQGNQNMIRIWGGGLYQRDYLYEVADKRGLLVFYITIKIIYQIWQEFMFACSLYPRNHEFLDTVQNEVRDVVRRLAPHPSIVLWSGNNENQGDLFEINYSSRSSFIRKNLRHNTSYKIFK